ncbi:BTAD domain-containing putative transcriptional regulator [Streptosporangium carneum]|uniref:SARP family transcriptional regulator n=1 Tax=Streptosporangium carneum TaxID=47481 RepID=A0A9W6MHP8_9ACTN|nr:BTAD domain-containing putative transcriptional regulator [Streptosporangium carneum]GLK14427.1 SARP family transcriptional regulator [Streptosporangium carneum]
MRFGILGTTRVWNDDGSEVPLGGPARRALLALLLAEPGEAVTADRLVDDLYDARDGAAHALQSQVSRLRRILEGGAAIESAPSGYRLAVDPGNVDADRFERLSEEGRRLLRSGDSERASALLREALALWRGPALADAAEAGAVQARILRLEERRLCALEDRIEADLRRGEHRAVVPELRELVAHHPLRERLRGLLMRALRADGRQAEALAAFEEARLLLAEELGTDPSAELAALHRELLQGERPFEPPAPPAQLTSFVGRAEDLAGVAELLGAARLVTLVGPGGAGKTRLSIEVASRMADVCFVELAPLRDGRGLPQALLGALGLRESALLGGPAEATPTSRLVTALADRSPLLLVLDNCEHVIDDAATLVERLLASCPGLRVLATSREPLGITGENLWPVRPLAPSSAARLFADRARAVRPGLVMDDADAEAVRHICRALDGLPLAIELAAARMRTHEAAELATRLDDRFRLLSRGSRTAQARHQTLRAVVAWSWDLLSEAEQTMARRLTVFSGGASVEAAARVCGVPDAEDVLDALVDKSLVEVGGGRYRMLDTIHAYCAEQLAAAGEAVTLRRAHADHFLELARSADPHLRRAEQVEWLLILSAEHDNLRTALSGAVEAGETELALRLLASLSTYHWMRGMRAATTPQAAALLDLVGERPPEGLEDEYVLCALAAAASDAGRQAWERHRRTAESIVVGPDRAHRYPVVTFLWPMVNAGAGDPSAALSVIARGRTASDPWERAAVHLLWGYPQFASGEPALAEHEFAAAADAFRSLGDRWGTALALDALAGLAATCGDPEKATVLTDEALTLTEELGATEDILDLLCNRGDYRVRATQAALVRGERPATLPTDMPTDMPTDVPADMPAGASPVPGSPGAGRGSVPRDAGAGLARARADYERATELARRVGSPAYLAAATRGLGDIARLQGDLEGARLLYERALERLETHWVRLTSHRAGALMGLGRIAEASGDLEAARSLQRRAVETSVAVGAVTESARPIEALAGIALLEGDAEEAALLLGAATAMRGVLVEDDPDVSRTAAAARAALGHARYTAAHRRGVRLSHEEALRLAGADERVIRESPISAMADHDVIGRSWS